MVGGKLLLVAPSGELLPPAEYWRVAGDDVDDDVVDRVMV